MKSKLKNEQQYAKFSRNKRNVPLQERSQRSNLDPSCIQVVSNQCRSSTMLMKYWCMYAVLLGCDRSKYHTGKFWYNLCSKFGQNLMPRRSPAPPRPPPVFAPPSRPAPLRHPAAILCASGHMHYRLQRYYHDTRQGITNNSLMIWLKDRHFSLLRTRFVGQRVRPSIRLTYSFLHMQNNALLAQDIHAHVPILRYWPLVGPS